MKKKTKFNIFLIIIIILMNLLLIYQFKNANNDVNNNDFAVIYYLLLFFISIITIIICNYIYEEDRLGPETMFLIIVPIFSVLMMLVIPFSNGHDEAIQWFRAFEISEGKFTTEIIDGKAMATIPEAIYNVSYRTNYSSVLSTLVNVIENSKRIDYRIYTHAVYSPINYLPISLSIFIAKSIIKNALVLAYAGRLGNLIVSICIMYFAVKKAPKFMKNLILLFAMLPSTIESICTISADGLTNSIALLLIALILNILYDENKKIQIKDKIILAVVTIVLALCKIVYLPMIFLLLLIPKEKFTSRKDRLLTLSIIIMLCLVLGMGWLQIAGNIVKGDVPESINKTEIIINNPIAYLQKILYTISIQSNNYILSAFGGQLEWYERAKSYIIPYILCFLSVYIALNSENHTEKLNKFQKLLIMLVVIGISALIFTSIYIQWADNKYLYINGVQGRYFIPILPLIYLLIMQQKKIQIQSKISTTKLLGIIGELMLNYIIMNIIICHLG